MRGFVKGISSSKYGHFGYLLFNFGSILPSTTQILLKQTAWKTGTPLHDTLKTKMDPFEMEIRNMIFQGSKSLMMTSQSSGKARKHGEDFTKDFTKVMTMSMKIQKA